MSVKSEIERLRSVLPAGVKLLAVSKFHPVEALREAYDAGQRAFGESRPQELKTKHELLPDDIEWHMIGHLQTNKVKYIAPYVHLVESLDSVRLAEAIELIKNRPTADLSLVRQVSWSALCEKLISIWNP